MPSYALTVPSTIDTDGPILDTGATTQTSALRAFSYDGNAGDQAELYVSADNFDADRQLVTLLTPGGAQILKESIGRWYLVRRTKVGVEIDPQAFAFITDTSPNGGGGGGGGGGTAPLVVDVTTIPGASGPCTFVGTGVASVAVDDSGQLVVTLASALPNANFAAFGSQYGGAYALANGTYAIEARTTTSVTLRPTGAASPKSGAAVVWIIPNP